MQAKVLKIGTRSSALALAQAHQVRNALLTVHALPAQAIEIIPLSTKGDRILNSALNSVGGKGLFTQEIEAALLEERIDIAVHSTKDMPAALPAGLCLSCFLKREDPRDAFIGKTAKKIADLPQGATIGTASIRRQALLRRLRPDINMILLRGNIQTRLKKLHQGNLEGTFLAYAGLKRLNLAQEASEVLSLDQFIPAPGQGVITIESRIGDKATNALLAPLNHQQTAIETSCERSFMTTLDGSCRTPLGAYARLNGQDLHLHAMIITPDGKIFHEIRIDGKAVTAKDLGQQAAATLRARAGKDFFAGWY